MSKQQLASHIYKNVINQISFEISQFWDAGEIAPIWVCCTQQLKFTHSEKATKFFKISTLDLSYVVPVKSTMQILKNFVAFSEYMNFTDHLLQKPCTGAILLTCHYLLKVRKLRIAIYVILNSPKNKRKNKKFNLKVPWHLRLNFFLFLGRIEDTII